MGIHKLSVIEKKDGIGISYHWIVQSWDHISKSHGGLPHPEFGQIAFVLQRFVSNEEVRHKCQH